MQRELGSSLAGRRVLVTGHTGFKGSWLSLWLHRLGARVTGFSLPPFTTPNLFDDAAVGGLCERSVFGDVREAEPLTRAIEGADPDVVFHLAAQALVRRSYLDPVDTFSTNFVGTLNLLEAVRNRSRPVVLVVVTSDKCYQNVGNNARLRETDPMGGNDPYSASKGATELLVGAYRSSFYSGKVSETMVATVRAGNVIGGGDWSDDRIIPDAVRALLAGRPIPVRNPDAVRPWQHVIDPLAGYIELAERLLGPSAADYCSSWNFGPEEGQDVPVSELVNQVIAEWGGGAWVHQPASEPFHESSQLRLDVEKSRRQLGWKARWDISAAISKTASWYRRTQLEGIGCREACDGDLDEWSETTT